jgi:hypothetical protein
VVTLCDWDPAAGALAPVSVASTLPPGVLAGRDVEQGSPAAPAHSFPSEVQFGSGQPRAARPLSCRSLRFVSAADGHFPALSLSS